MSTPVGGVTGVQWYKLLRTIGILPGPEDGGNRILKDDLQVQMPG